MKPKYLLILLLLNWFNASAQRNREIIFNERQADSIDNKIDSLLLIGIGSTTTRIFLDDLSQYVIQGLNDDSIVARYYYLGRSMEEAQPEFDTISKKGYKAILFFLPKGGSNFDVQGQLNRISADTRGLGRITISSASSRIDYYQSFNFQLCTPTANMNAVWTALVEFSGDLSKSRNAKKVATKLLSSFKKHKYLK